MNSLTLTTLLTLFAIICVHPQQFDDRPIITVNGDAVVTVQPDQIVINFGIETWDQRVTNSTNTVCPGPIPTRISFERSCTTFERHWRAEVKRNFGLSVTRALACGSITAGSPGFLATLRLLTSSITQPVRVRLIWGQSTVAR